MAPKGELRHQTSALFGMAVGNPLLTTNRLTSDFFFFSSFFPTHMVYYHHEMYFAR